MSRSRPFWLAAGLLCAAAASASAQAMPAHAGAVPRVGLVEFKRALDRGDVIAVDVRTPDEFTAGRIPGARLVTLAQLEARAAELRSLQKPIVTYCT